MTDNIFPLKPRGELKEDQQKSFMLEVIDRIRIEIEAGRIKEIVATSIDQDGDAQIHVATLDLPGAVGLYEIGKHILISQQP